MILDTGVRVAQTVKRLPTMWETRVQSLGWEDLLEKEMVTRSRFSHPKLLLPGKSHGWRSLVGYSPWGCKESRTWLSDFTFRSLLVCVLCNDVPFSFFFCTVRIRNQMSTAIWKGQSDIQRCRELVFRASSGLDNWPKFCPVLIAAWKS